MGRRIAILFALATAAPAAARDGDASAMAALSRLFEGIPHRVAFRDPYAFLALDSGLAVYDLRNPAAPARVSHLYLPSPALDVELAGNLAYVANGESGLAVVDVADVARPVLAGRLDEIGVRAVAVQGALAYLAVARPGASPPGGLRVADVTVATSPQPRGFAPLANGALDVVVSADLAWVGLGADLALPHGLALVDVLDPAAPVELPARFFPTGRAVHQIASSAGLVHLATGFPSTGEIVTALAATRTSAPAELSSVPLTDAARGVTRYGNTLFVAARALGLLTLDVTDPTAPVLLDAMPTGREAVGVASYLNLFAFVAERSSIRAAVFTVADAQFPQAVREVGTVAFAEATAVAARPSLGLFLARDALHLADTSNLSAPAWLASWRRPGADYHALDVEGNLAAVAEGDAVHLVDITDPSAPAALGDAVVSEGVAVRPVLAGNTLYVVSGAGLESFDITSPGAPTWLGSLRTPGWAADLAVEGSLGYLVAGPTLWVVDLASPALPTLRSQLDIPGEQLYAVDAEGALAVATGYGATLRMFDLTVPTSPVLAGTLAGPGGFDVRLSGDHAVVAAGTSGVASVDVADPGAPFLDGSYDTSGSAVGVGVDGTTLLLAAAEAQQWLLRCDNCPPAQCVDTWPLLAPNSLKARHSGGDGEFWWQSSGGSGAWNVHRTQTKSELTDCWFNPGCLLASVAAPPFVDPAWAPTGQVLFYRVWPRGSCLGDSKGP